MKQEMKRANSFPLRLTPTMRQQMELLAKREGVSLNQFISLAVAEKVMRMEGYAQPDGGEMPWLNVRMKDVKKV